MAGFPLHAFYSLFCQIKAKTKKGVGQISLHFPAKLRWSLSKKNTIQELGPLALCHMVNLALSITIHASTANACPLVAFCVFVFLPTAVWTLMSGKDWQARRSLAAFSRNRDAAIVCLYVECFKFWTIWQRRLCGVMDTAYLQVSGSIRATFFFRSMLH